MDSRFSSSPHYFYPADKGWKFNGPLEIDEVTSGSFACKEVLNLDGLEGSGAFQALRWQNHRSRATPRVRARDQRPRFTDNEVWVNTRSGKYWKSGSRYFGKTKEGEFKSELEALDRGYSPAGGTGQ